MASTNRQNSLLAAKAWQRIYRTFQQADFKSYDFDTIRRTLIDYIKLNYAESFNDFIESSEYIALIDLIAYVAQSISYRVDLNARENFIDLAERKESVLRLARLISYQPKRNIAGSGFLSFLNILKMNPGYLKKQSESQFLEILKTTRSFEKVCPECRVIAWSINFRFR